MAQSGYPLPSYPPVSEPTTSDYKAQTVYPPTAPVGYPPMSQPNYTQASQPGYPTAPPAPYPPMSQSNNEPQGYQAALPAGYPPVSQPNSAQQQGYQTASPAGYPPVSQPNIAPQQGYHTAPPAGYPPVSQSNSVPQQGYHTATPVAYPPMSQSNNAQGSQPGYPTPTTSQAGYPQVSQPNYAPSVAAVPAPTLQPNYNSITNPLPVLGRQYCLPHLVDLAVTRKLMSLTDDFVVTDVNKNVMFKVKGKIFSLHDKRVLLDSTGKPIVTLRQKILTAHSRWLAYRGDSSDSRDLLFTAKTSSVIQLKTKLNVYLGNRTSEGASDFKVHGTWSERSCAIYVGESNTIAAQMHKKESSLSFFLGKDTFMITIYPNVDYAFVVALIVILDAINTSDNS